MYERAFHLEIVTPERVVFQGDATSLSAPGVMGGFQVLVDHAPMIAAIGVGELKVKGPGGDDTRYCTGGGFVEVKQNRVVVLAQSVERSDEIDVERAKSAKERAARRLQARTADIDIERARAALLRATNRLRLAEVS